jgi:hypothetical protein
MRPIRVLLEVVPKIVNIMLKRWKSAQTIVVRYINTYLLIEENNTFLKHWYISKQWIFEKWGYVKYNKQWLIVIINIIEQISNLLSRWIISFSHINCVQIHWTMLVRNLDIIRRNLSVVIVCNNFEVKSSIPSFF